MTDNRIIPWATRTDLQSFQSGEGALAEIAIKDPISNAFYHFGEIEYFILESLKNRIALSRLQSDIELRFGMRLSSEELLIYIERLARDNLLVALRLGDGKRLFQQQQRSSRGQIVQQFMGLLSIKFPGFHPGGLLSLLRVPGWICFHPLVVLMVCVSAFATFAFALLSLDMVIAKIPSFRELLIPSHIALMVFGFVVAKVLHELGHGLACQRTGHECNEMGVMLLVGIPCMYCDVSDLWTERSRWQRIIVSLAGVLVEISIATLCFWGWYLSVDGTLHRFLFGMTMITSFNTLFVNGNPLMRYDGYYALSDWLRIPNLAAVSKEALQGRVRAWFLRGENSFTLNQKTNTLIGYAVLAMCYRCFIMLAIGWGVWMFFDTQQLRSFGRLAIGMVALMTLIPVWMTVQGFASSAWKQGLKITNATVAVILLAFLYLCLANLEFRQRVYGDAEIQLADAKQLFSPVSGRLEIAAFDGQPVSQGDRVATVIDDELRLDAIVTQGEAEEIRLRLQSLEIRGQQIDNEGQIAFWKKRLATVEERLAEIQERQESMTLLAPVDGLLVAKRMPEGSKPDDDGMLESVEGSLFSIENQGAYVSRGENLCYIATPEICRGFLKIDESEIELVKIDHTVRVYVSNSDRVIEGKVTRIAMESEREAEESLAADQNFEDPVQFFRIEFDFPSDQAIRIGSKHRVVIQCEPTTSLGYLKRWWRNSFWY